ncbi:nucleoside-diphosphate sugar epimerase [Candidatus Magnetomorum sp. HK-1]|nr:nucleoside-diphosphate sugar epimerase [Candidatus Magnetomorum sp. HK-1]
MKIHHFIKKSHLSVPVEKAFYWHEQPGAIQRLTPPWEKIRVIKRTGGIQEGGKATFKVKTGPLWIEWKARHIAYEKNKMFRDIQRKGPFLFWEHTHNFEPDGQHACYLEDHIRFRLPLSPISDALALNSVKERLNQMFTYRHTVTQNDLSLLSGESKNLNIVMTGVSGVLGDSLVPFLTTQGHSVTRMVRRSPRLPDESYWNPDQLRIDNRPFNNANAVIHLAGEYIGEGRWTKQKKKRIIDSRVKGTSLIAQTLCNMESPPETLICASAIGYYGNRGDEIITEDAGPGNDFISDVCQQWEEAAEAAVARGIRVVFLRIGVVLTPRGGALERLLPAFKMGFGMTFGQGDQVVSWISADDFMGVINHALRCKELSGPVNVTAPHPVHHRDLTKILARSLKRPALIHLPDWVIKRAFGQMGNEVLLSGNCAIPQKLLSSGYQFHHPKLDAALTHLLGLHSFDNEAAKLFKTQKSV